MEEIAKGEGKRAPFKSPLLSDQDRGSVSPLGGEAVGWKKSGESKSQKGAKHG